MSVEPTRIVFFIENPGPGGAEQVVVSLAEALEARGAKTTTVSLRDGWLGETLRERGMRYIRLPSDRRLDVSLPFRLARLVRAERADCLHSHLLDSNFYGALSAAVGRFGHLATEHGDVHHSVPRKLLGRKMQILGMLGTQFSSVSNFTADRMAELGIARKKIAVIHNPVFHEFRFSAASRRDIRGQLGVDSDAERHWLWLHIARLGPVKDQHSLLRGFKRSQELSGKRQSLCILGDGETRAELEQLASELGISANVHFMGFRNDIPDFLCAADGFVLTSLSEALPMVLLEAASARLAIVTTDVGGIRDVIPDESCGFLIKPGDSELLGQALTSAIANHDLRITMANACWAHVERVFSLDAVVGQYLDMYRRLSRKSGGTEELAGKSSIASDV